MVKSIFTHILPHVEGGKISKLKQLLTELGIYNSFAELETDYKKDWEKVATYIIFTYCHDSTFVIANVDFEDIKQKVFSLVKLKPEDYPEVYSWTKQSVKDAILCVSEVKNDKRWKELRMMNEAVINLDDIAVTKPDPKQKTPAKNIRDAAVYSSELRERISSLEKVLLQQTKSTERLKEVKEIIAEDEGYETILKYLQKNTPTTN